MTKPNKKAAADAVPPPSKISQVLALLERHEGASLEDMTATTAWLPHTMRAALTGLRKKGYQIARTSVDGVNRYTMIARSDPSDQ